MLVKPFSGLSTTELYEILKARFIVFYSEQNCRYLDMDDIDYTATHIALFRKGQVIAYARLFQGDSPEEWHLGRMLAIERGRGFGRRIVMQAEEYASSQGAKAVLLHAQTHAVPFYEKMGYTAYGPVFMEADIPHVAMRKELMNDGLSRSQGELNDGMMNDGMMNDGMMNDGLRRSQGELNDEMMK